MADEKQAKVEKYRLTPEQLAWTKGYKQLKLIEQMLQRATLTEKAKFQSLSEMWRALQMKFSELPNPKQPVRELQGMNFPAEEAQSPIDQQSGGEGMQPPAPQDMMLRY